MSSSSHFCRIAAIFAGFFFAVANVSAGIIDNQSYDLADVDSDPLWIKTGTGGIVSNSIVGALEVTRDTWAVGGSNNFLVEAVVSSSLPATAGEAGARIWIRAHMDDLLSLNQYRDIQVRLVKEVSSADNFIGLYDVDGNLVQVSGGGDAKIALRWDQTSPRFRIRLMRQGDEIRMEAEPSNSFDDGALTQSIAAPLANFPSLLGAPNLQQVGFGNGKPSGNETSTWESIHVTETDNATTVLPYWPPMPPSPVLVHDDKGAGNPQGIDLSVDFSGVDYLSNDTVTPELDADGITYVGDTRTNPNNLETWDFYGLNDNQIVYGRVIAAEVSGRSETSSDASAIIASQAPSLSCWGFAPPLDKGPITVKGKNRALPLKAQLLDSNNLPVTDQDILTPPKVQVLYDEGIGGVPVDVEDDVLSAGQGTEGVYFVYTENEQWQFNLKTGNHSAPGTYLIEMVSGDSTEYIVEPTCEVSFLVP